VRIATDLARGRLTLPADEKVLYVPAAQGD
jgi:hypothetical protein